MGKKAPLRQFLIERVHRYSTLRRLKNLFNRRKFSWGEEPEEIKEKNFDRSSKRPLLYFST